MEKVDTKIVKLRKPTRTQTNKERRDREYLTEGEIDSIIKVVRKSSYNALRDELLIVCMYKHGLRVSEAVNMKWSQVDFKDGVLHVKRLKGSKDSVHPIPGDELRLFRRMERKNQESGGGRYVFLSNRGAVIQEQTIRKSLERFGKLANIPFPIHPHMLRHSCGYYLVNRGVNLRAIQMYMGHASINNTVIYTQLDNNKFSDFWD